MPNSHRIRTQLGVDKVLQINLDQDYDTLDLLSFSFFPNDVYTRSCADFGVVCGRVFCNRGLGLVNARVSIFIPIQSEDESNPVISTLYPYKSFVDFNEDGYKYNLLPYSPSHSGHVPVGTFPDRLDALTNQTVIEVYDKYYKFTAKTNDAGDFMIFGVPVGQYNLFMQVDLSDIGEFSLTPQDLIRMGRATEAQVAGTKFRFSENYSELPQIITLTKVIQIAPFYGQDGICQHYITRADFDLTTEASVELQPTAIFMGSVISAEDRKKLKRRCRVPAKQGWLCNLITGPGQIETIRHTIQTDSDGRPILEQYRLQNDGKLIDENGTWVVELPMNLDYVYTDEFGNRRISLDGKVGVPVRGKYRFKIKWQQSPNLSEENRRAYFLVPNIKEHGWPENARTDTGDPGLAENINTTYVTLPHFPPTLPDETASPGPFDVTLNLNTNYYYNVKNTENLQSYVILVDGQERPDLNDTIPLELLTGSVLGIRYTLIDPALDAVLTMETLNGGQFRVQSSYAFSVSWSDYGSPEMVQEAINCQDRFFEFQYNKVYTVSQLIDRYSNRIFPQKSIQIKHILDDKCEGDYNPFPTNDAYYRYDLLYITINVILTIMKFQFFQILIFLHVLATLWPIIAVVLVIVWAIQQLVYAICKGLQKLGWRDRECKEPKELRDLLKNPFKNLNLPLFLYTEDGCERCRCKIDPQDLDEENNGVLFDLIENLTQIEESNISYLANFAILSSYRPWNNNLSSTGIDPYYLTQSPTYDEAVSVMLAGNSAANIEYRRMPIWAGNDGDGRNFRVFSTSLTIAERLNLFNTKAKYFNNLTVNAPGDNDFQRVENSLSPGNIGWNQIRVTWNTPDNNPNTTFHYDNVIVILTDRPSFNKGDVLSFQDPGMSNDPHVLTTTGICINPSYVVVNYANNETNPNESPLRSVIYDIDSSRYPQVFTPSSTPGQEGRVGVLTKKQVCFPMDIEYFQVLQEMSYSDYYFYSFSEPPLPASDNRFSLPWRILRNQRGADLDNGAFLKYYTTRDNWLDTRNVNFGNGQWVYRQVVAEQGTFECFGACFYNTTHVTNNLNPIRSYFPYSESDPGFLSTERPDPNLRVVFLQRGVDINAPRLRNKYDLRRLFGVATNWNITPRINHQDTNIGADFDISDVCIIEGMFFPNVPIQPGGQKLFGYNTANSCGWLLNGIIQQYGLNGLPIYNPEYQFLGVLETNLLQPNNGVITLGPLNLSSETFIDENGIFNGEVLTAPVTSEYGFRVFLKYSGLVNFTNGLSIIIRDITNTQIIWTDTVDVSTNISNYFQVVILQLTQGHQYRLEVRNFTLNEITYYADLLDWVTENPQGLKLPKHNEFTENSSTPPNPRNGNIFYASQFFRIPTTSFTPFTSRMPNYYSALDENTEFFGSGSNSWRPIFQPNLNDGGIRSNGMFGTTVISNSTGYGSEDNMFSRVLVPDNSTMGGPSSFLKIPCAYSSVIDQPWQYCGTEPDTGVVVDGGCNCDTDNLVGCPGCCRYRQDLYYRMYVYHADLKASELNEVGGYWGKEYIEGGSAFSLNLFYSSDNFQELYSDSLNCGYSNPQGGGVFGNSNDPQWTNGGGRCYTNSNGNCATQDRAIIFNNISQQYISPCYANFPDVDPNPDFVNIFGSLEEARRTWYVNPNHEIEINYPAMNVFRTDRLPSSTTPQGDGNGNGYLLHQNNGFSIFKINIDDCSYELQGGGEIPDPVQSVEVDYDNLPGDGVYAEVANSLSNCALAVDLNSYYVDGDGNPAIWGQDPYSREPAAIGADWIWFNRGRGCYNLVSKPLASLFPHKIDGDPQNKWYWDVASVVEWIQRLKLTFAQCFEIFSHTFSNNWINGTLYAFPFQNATRFNSQNQPIRFFCKDVIYFHDPLNNYYYRSSPWNGTNFVGKYRDEGERGNLRNLLYPTTILDMGPKAAFIQEIVYSDDYDGYIVPRIPTTSFQNVTDILNLFILNRLVNTNFIQQLIPLPVDEAGNEEGSDDPSVGAMFANTRWKNGDAFFANLLPGLIDADYSQLISINSEFGVGEYSTDTYTSNDVFFGEDEGRGSILGFLGREYSTKRPVLGIYFSGDNQLRDYISPRRTIWNQNALIPVQDADFTDITTKTQIVPFYQWNIFHDRADPDEGPSIFGTQSNNFITDLNKDGNYYTNSSTFPDGFFAHGYQSLDRFGNSSEYFNPNGNNTFTYKGYIINYNEQVDADGNITGYTPTFNAQRNPRYRYTFGAPFHFYFGLKQGASAMDRFISIYIDTTVVYE